MKRFAVFAGSNHHPVGGMDDFLKSFDSWEEAQDFIDMKKNNGEGRDWMVIEDMELYE